ncbi:MAG TPA: phenylalanine--tRNA ligase subunit beta [Gaiellaceae bacterium]|jgi:phenylalanyl-tRNA synthetase beta chain|nr:phenylalanine--tRNA ligase subunit beta [Gaiellaceae bacterium]
MKVPVSWLKEYVDLELPIEELARQLVFTSCEVDRIVRRGVPAANGNYRHFVVGKVLEAGKHPNADKLQLTKVDTGDGEPRSIVCGAWNFGAGATVAVVVPGGVMPGGEFTIEKRKLRGEVSDGMILSERELELGQDHGGIMLLPDELAAGTPLEEVLPLGDDILEIETLYNRPDLTAVYGIAREVAALTGATLRPQPGVEPERDGDERFDVVVEDLDACPRFIARTFRDVTLGESPAWLKARLIGAGMRPISNVVDITNYVMLALGSPLHAYDAATLHGDRIVVRRARAGEELVTLDGQRRTLDARDLVIADADRAIGLAGILGGENTEMGETATSVVLETANFEPVTVMRTGERHHTRSEAQTRWEKGVDPEAAADAARYASQLLVDLAGARWTGETEVRGELAAPPAIAYRPGYATEALGLEVPESEQRERLGRLGFTVSGDWTVTAPSWRARDVRRDVDVVEEVARFRLESVPATLPRRQAMFGRLTHEQRLRRRVEDVLAGAGLYEAYTYSLQPHDPDPNAIELPVPLSSQQRVLRTTLAIGLIAAAKHNVDMGNGDVGLFEVAHVYLPPGPVPQERWRLGGIVQGDFFRAKGIVEAVFAALQVEPVFARADFSEKLVVGAAVQSGWVGTYGPLEVVEGEWSAFELDLSDLFALVPERILYRDVITFPPVRQDLAFVVDESVPAGELIAAAREAAGEELREARFLSDYRGDQIPDGKKSVAFAVEFQSSERTLADEDAARLRGAIVAELGARFDAELRA